MDTCPSQGIYILACIAVILIVKTEATTSSSLKNPEKRNFCDFETSLSDCSYTHETKSSDLKWRLNRGSTPTSNTGPDADHTTGTERGQYLYMETSSGRQGSRAVVRSAGLSVRDLYTVDFWYHMYGAEMGRLTVYAQDNADKTHRVWSRQGSSGKRWHRMRLDLPAGTRYVLFEGMRGASFRSDVALDDVSITCRQCAYENVDVTSPPDDKKTVMKCDFDADLCGFSQSKKDDFDWTMQTGATFSQGTGPSGDHTSGAGGYVYAETSDPRRGGDRAVLVSGFLPQGRGRTVSVWYHMMGQHVGQLAIQGVMEGSPKARLLWSKRGNQGQAWQFTGDIQIPDNTDKIEIVSIVGGGYQGDIAIDDLVIKCEQCMTTRYDGVTTSGGHVTSTIRPTTSAPDGTGSLPVSCDFEKDLCGFTLSTNDVMIWRRWQKQTPSVGTGPSRDHTRADGKGHYVYIETTRKPQGATATLTYSLKQATGSGHCIRFWYHMFGHHIGSLQVTADSNIIKEIKGDIDVNKDDRSWHEVSVSLPVGSRTFAFVGIRGDGYQGDIGLDDVSVSQGTC